MYKVGQVLYAILSKKQKIIPVQIVEHVIRRSLNEEAVQYLVRVPLQSELIDLESFGEEIYPTIELVKDRLHQRLSHVINDMAAAASELSVEHFNLIPTEESIENIQGGEVVQVELTDGTLANVKFNEVDISVDKAPRKSPTRRGRSRKGKK